MKYSLAFKCLVVVLVLLTLAWKLEARANRSSDLSDMDVQNKVADFLTTQSFVVERAEKINEGQPLVRANTKTCQILVARSPAMGWDRDLIRQYATGRDRIFTVFAGKTYKEQPTWRTVPDFLWARFRRELGFSAQASAVLAVIEKPGCEAEKLPWQNL